MTKTYETESYKSHENHINKTKNGLIRLENQTSINNWRHQRMFNLTLPLLKDKEKWLTVGDGFGTDANWLSKQNVNVVASDISDAILKKAKEQNYIPEYSKQNAEHISFENNSFDYVLCKEAYHHFPRPYIAVYEMIRVARKGIILIEPLDVAIQMPTVLFLKNILDKISPQLINKIWKNRYSFEIAGNYVYKTSEREIEKIAMGINLPYIAFKGINDCYTTSLDLSQPLSNKKIFKKFKSKIKRRNLISKLRIVPYQMQASIIFKTPPSEQIKQHLKTEKYKLIKLKANPYL